MSFVLTRHFGVVRMDDDASTSCLLIARSLARYQRCYAVEVIRAGPVTRQETNYRQHCSFAVNKTIKVCLDDDMLRHLIKTFVRLFPAIRWLNFRGGRDR